MADVPFLIPDLKAGQIHRTELTVKKSRFITSLAHTRGSDECKAFVAKITAEFSDARHNCFAYNGCEPGSTAQCGCSDDGEPHGTAGQPMLNVLLHSGCGEVTAVVTRYFGGILLGTGGLVKAYQDSVKGAFATLKLKEFVPSVSLRLEFGPKFIGPVTRLCQDLNCEILRQEFNANAIFMVTIPEQNAAELKGRLNDLTRGGGRIEETD